MSNILLVKKKKESLHWPPWNIDALSDDCVWSLIYWDCLEMSDMLVREAHSILADFEDTNPLLEHNDNDDDDEDKGNTITPF